MKTLERQGLIKVRKRIKAAPLSPTGATPVNVYTLVGPLVPPAAATTTRKKSTTKKKTGNKKTATAKKITRRTAVGARS